MAAAPVDLTKLQGLNIAIPQTQTEISTALRKVDVIARNHLLASDLVLSAALGAAVYFTALPLVAIAVPSVVIAALLVLAMKKHFHTITNADVMVSQTVQIATLQRTIVAAIPTMTIEQVETTFKLQILDHIIEPSTAAALKKRFLELSAGAGWGPTVARCLSLENEVRAPKPFLSFEMTHQDIMTLQPSEAELAFSQLSLQEKLNATNAPQFAALGKLMETILEQDVAKAAIDSITDLRDVLPTLQDWLPHNERLIGLARAYAALNQDQFLQPDPFHKAVRKYLRSSGDTIDEVQLFQIHATDSRARTDIRKDVVAASAAWATEEASLKAELEVLRHQLQSITTTEEKLAADVATASTTFYELHANFANLVRERDELKTAGEQLDVKLRNWDEELKHRLNTSEKIQAESELKEMHERLKALTNIDDISKYKAAIAEKETLLDTKKRLSTLLAQREEFLIDNYKKQQDLVARKEIILRDATKVLESVTSDYKSAKDAYDKQDAVIHAHEQKLRQMNIAKGDWDQMRNQLIKDKKEAYTASQGSPKGGTIFGLGENNTEKHDRLTAELEHLEKAIALRDSIRLMRIPLAERTKELEPVEKAYKPAAKAVKDAEEQVKIAKDTFDISQKSSDVIMIFEELEAIETLENQILEGKQQIAALTEKRMNNAESLEKIQAQLKVLEEAKDRVEQMQREQAGPLLEQSRKLTADIEVKDAEFQQKAAAAKTRIEELEGNVREQIEKASQEYQAKLTAFKETVKRVA